MSKRNFFAELKRRHVYRVAVAYVVVAWLAIQAGSILLPTFGAPGWVMRVVVLIVALGFPIAVILAWAFERTPQGLKRTEDADGAPEEPAKGHAWIYVVVIAGLIAATLFFVGRYTAQAPRQREAATVLNAKSIAVLPFDNLSRDPENAFFAEGVQDEILTRLAKVADLKVISRTSTMRFKSAPSDLRDIAKQLGVTNILEGSVQKANDQVRVNVQLINAVTDTHLWAEIYDRRVTDIFVVESEIAKTIAETLRAKLTGSEKDAMSKKPTENSEAYDSYLRGRFFWNKRTSFDLPKAVGYYNQAIAKDPNYALAYAGLADAYCLYPDYGVGAPAEFYPKTREMALKAMSLEPSLGEPHAALGQVYSGWNRDFAKATAEFERAIQLNPNYATAHQWSTTAWIALGNTERALKESRKAVELDPLSLIVNADLAYNYINARQFDNALAQCRKTLEMDPNFRVVREYLGLALQAKGKLPEALAEFRTSAVNADEPFTRAMLGQACARSGLREEAERILAGLEQESRERFVSGWSIAVIRLALGDKNGAITALTQAIDQNAPEVLNIRCDPLLDDLRGDPAFEALVQKVSTPRTD